MGPDVFKSPLIWLINLASLLQAKDAHLFVLKLIYLLSVFLLVYFLQQEQETSYTILRSKGTNVTLNGLKPDTTYLLQIRARTAAGYGGSSRKFEFETSPDCKYLLTSCHTVLYLQSHSPSHHAGFNPFTAMHNIYRQYSRNSLDFSSPTLSTKSFTQ